jgi:sigma-B regulation protein RsbU (phosphoserine phosphatase)
MGRPIGVVVLVGVLTGAAWLASAAQGSGEQAAPPASELARVSRGDGAAFARIALGFVLLSAGATALAASAMFQRAAGLTVFTFGVFTCLYGARILTGVPQLMALLEIPRRVLLFSSSTINYLLPVAGLAYAERVRGPGWKGTLGLSWRLGVVLAAGFVAYDHLVGAPWASLAAYRAALIAAMIVLVPHVIWWRQRDPVESAVRTVGTLVLAAAVMHDALRSAGLTFLPFALEVYGVTAFVAGLGFVTARRAVADQRERAAVERELETARTIQAAILPHALPEIPGLRLAVRHSAMGSVAGDVYDFVQVDRHRVGLLVGDVAGHGVPAALIASMATVAFTLQRSHADEPARTLDGVNRALYGHFEARFVTAAYVFVDVARGILRYSLAGHPPPLLWKRATGELQVLAEGGLVLGLFADATYPSTEVAVQAGDRLVLYTDGLVEVANAAGEWFGERELAAFIRSNGSLPADRFVDELVRHVHRWSGRAPGQAFEDDLTILVADWRCAGGGGPGATPPPTPLHVRPSRKDTTASRTSGPARSASSLWSAP